MQPTRVLIVDDHVIVRRGIQMFLNTDASIEVVGEAEEAEAAVHMAQSLKPDVILMDLLLARGDGVQAIAEIKAECPEIRILVLSSFGDVARVTASLEAGADGYLLKDADGKALLEAIHAVQAGQTPIDPHVARHLLHGVRGGGGPQTPDLTEREHDVLRLLAGGLSNRAIAARLGLSPGTVKVHVSHILGKLGVSSRTEAAVEAVKLGLAAPERGGNSAAPDVDAR